MIYSIGYKPKTINQVNWYVSPEDRRSSIHVFDTQAEAVDWAKSQPEPKHPSGIIVPAYVGWLHKGEPAQLEVSNTRHIVDHRVKTKVRGTSIVNGRVV